MQKKDFSLEAESKENAMKYFPQFFGSDCNILSDKTLKELREEYLKYCEKYFAILNESANLHKVNIKKAYDYMQSVLEKRTKTYQIKSEITEQVLASYDELIDSIAGYKFVAHWKKSYGSNQNQANKQMLFEISLLKPMLIMVLENIDSYFEKISDISEVTSFDNQLREKLEELIEMLNDANVKLDYAEEDYHNKWNSVNRRLHYGGDATESDLGKSKVAWKSAKNDACRSILSFYKEIKEINSLLQPSNMVHTLDEIDELYNCGIETIVSGPNYYSYLNEEERNDLTEQNKLRKIKLKNKAN